MIRTRNDQCRGRARLARAATAAAFLALLAVANAPVRAETAESLPNFPGREETFGSCIGCHSFTVVGRQGMSRERWDATLTWMQEKHAMPDLGPDLRRIVLDYLAQAYPDRPAAGGGWVNPFAPRN
jgi:hypothetical protein